MIYMYSTPGNSHVLDLHYHVNSTRPLLAVEQPARRSVRDPEGREFLHQATAESGRFLRRFG
jgi:hypothetical protein